MNRLTKSFLATLAVFASAGATIGALWMIHYLFGVRGVVVTAVIGLLAAFWAINYHDPRV